MSPLDRRRLSNAVALASGDPRGLADEFHRRLAGHGIRLGHRFGVDPAAQGRKLAAVLALLVASLEGLDGIMGDIRRAEPAGILADRASLIGGALIETLEARLPAAFEPICQAGWGIACGVLAEAMLSAPTEERRRAA